VLLQPAGHAACALGFAVLLVASHAFAGSPAASATAAATFHRDLKRLEVDLLHAGARLKLAERAALRAAWQRRQRAAPGTAGLGPHGPGSGIKRARDAEEAGGPQGARPVARGTNSTRIGAPANYRINDRESDRLGASTQSEVTIAVFGSQIVAAWNDAESGVSGALGYGWSTDGGATWTDGGALVASSELARWVSDPAVTVNERTGVFYLAGMAITPHAQSAIGVLRGRFEGGTLVWGPPTLARAVRDTLPDKPWIVADSTTGHLYLTYTAFYRAGPVQIDQIEYQRCRDDNRSWERPIVLSSGRDLGLVQASRPAVGPDGELHVIWAAVDTSLAAGGLDWIRSRSSTDQGGSFGVEQDVAGMYSNFGSGAPGFNRGYGIVFPSLAVDRSMGPHRGRVYAAWNEGLDYFDDAPGDSNPRFEREPNSLPQTATPFNIGETVRGAITAGDDIDTYRFLGKGGSTVIVYLDSLATTLDVAARLTCSDAETRLAYSAPVWPGRTRVLVFTLPRSDIFFLRLDPIARRTGGYRMRTGLVVPGGHERARDHRDVFVAARDRRGGWETPVRVNGSAPRFDDWLPEVAVAANGRVYVAWYDWRDDVDVTCGGASHVFLARSDDGGRVWSEVGTMSDVATDWTNVASLIAPNQGDYIAMFADHDAVTVAWADGREGDPDVVVARHALERDPLPAPFMPVAMIERVSPNPSRGELLVEFALSGGTSALLELVDLGGRRVQVQSLGNPGPGRHATRFVPGAGVKPGVYWLRLVENGRGNARMVAIIP